MTVSEEAFLNHIRRQITRRPRSPHPGPWTGPRAGESDAAWRPGDLSGLADEKDELVQRFTAELTAVGGHAVRVVNEDGLREELNRLQSELGLQSIIVEDDRRAPDPDCAQWIRAARGLAGAYPSEGPDAPGRRHVPGERADAGVTWADYGIAETGTLVLCSAPGRSRLLSLLPPIHIALLPVARLVPSRAEVWPAVFGPETRTSAGGVPANVVHITGPSRTADIENDLTIGVHGPGQVYVFILG